MQYHYVVYFDTDKNDWFIEADPFDHFPDGNIWQDDIGWHVADEGSEKEALDVELWHTLRHCVPGILPSPYQEV